MLRFYEEDLGFVVSYYVFEDEAGAEPTAGFFRSDRNTILSPHSLPGDAPNIML